MEIKTYIIIREQFRSQNPQVAIETLLRGQSTESNLGDIIRTDKRYLTDLTGSVYLAQLIDREHQARFSKVLYVRTSAPEVSLE